MERYRLGGRELDTASLDSSWVENMWAQRTQVDRNAYKYKCHLCLIHFIEKQEVYDDGITEILHRAAKNIC